MHSPRDEAQIRALYDQMMDGWNRGDATAFAAPFTDDADFIAFDGSHYTGKSEIIASHQPLFDKWMKGTRLVAEIQSVRFLTPEVAIMLVIGGTIMRGKTNPAPERNSIQALVAVKRDETWALTLFQNTRVRPIGTAGGTFVWLFSDRMWKLLHPRD